MIFVSSTPIMPKVTLVFPDTFLLSDFILGEKIIKMEINSALRSVKGRFSEQLLLRAKNGYQAKVFLQKSLFD
jgi:hypothetical protein